MKTISTLLAVIAVCAAAIFLFSGNPQKDFQQCADTMSERYPSSKPVPPGQPFTDMYKCMVESGYDLDYQPTACGGRDYAASIMDARCYRPVNAIKGYFHDLKTVFR